MARDLWRWLTLVVVSAVCVAAAAQDKWGNKPTVARGLIHNEDCSNYFMLRGPQEMTVEALRAYLDPYAGTQLTHLFLNVNAMRTSFGSKVWDPIWGDGDPDQRIAAGRFSEHGAAWARNTYLLDQKGIDPYAVWIARARELSISPWISMRMNDCHENDNVESYLHSKFWVAHPEFWRGGEGYFARCLDYGAQEVRDHHMALVKEYLERYDLDGLELDWMRECYCFKPGEEAKGRAILTDFMRQVRALADARGKERGRPIQLAARVPAVPEASFGMGLDAVTWAKEGLVDMLVPTARWVTADFDIPMERWREMLGDTCERMTLAAGMEVRVQPYPGAAAMMRDLEMLRGFSASMLERGADQIYLFNHMRSPQESIEEYRKMYTQPGSLETLVGKPRRHPVTYHDIDPPAQALPKLLPTALTGENAAAFTIHSGPKPSSGRVLVRVGLGPSTDVAEARLAVRVNGTECARADDHPELGLFCSPARVLQFDVPLDAMKKGANEVEVSVQSGNSQQIVWMEIAIVP